MIGRVLTGRHFNVACRMLLGIMFVFAAWDKVAHPNQFAIAVRAYQIVPLSVSNLFAVGMAWAELIAGIMLIVGVLTRKAAGAVFIMLGMFVVAMATVMIRGMVVDCGCFGDEGGSMVGPLLILRNLVLMTAAFIVMRYNDGAMSVFPGYRAVDRRAPA